MQAPRVKKSDRTRQFIIEKAAPVFNKKGIAGTSLSDLTHATGLTKGSIYGNFKDKDDLAVSVFKYNIAHIEQIFSHELGKAGTCAEKLLVYPRIYRKIYKTMTAYGGCPILNTATEADDTHHILCKLVAEAVIRWKNQIIELIDAGKQTGEIQPDTDATAISEIIISLFEGGGILAKVTGEETYMTHTLEHMEKLIESICIM
jgi:AcrR family transcriptional regulator